MDRQPASSSRAQARTEKSPVAGNRHRVDPHLSWPDGRGEKVVQDGFEYCGQRYRSLSAIARAATGTRWKGQLFFGLTKRRQETKRAAH